MLVSLCVLIFGGSLLKRNVLIWRQTLMTIFVIIAAHGNIIIRIIIKIIRIDFLLLINWNKWNMYLQ